MKQDSVDRSHSELKKLRRKSQGKNANKYENKESEVRRMQILYRCDTAYVMFYDIRLTQRCLYVHLNNNTLALIH